MLKIYNPCHAIMQPVNFDFNERKRFPPIVLLARENARLMQEERKGKHSNECGLG